MAVRIVAHAFEIVHLLTDQNPVQVYVRANLWGSMAVTYSVLPRTASLMPSSTLVLARTRPVSDPREPSVVKPSMSRPSVVSTRPSPSSPSVSASRLSAPNAPSLSVSARAPPAESP